MHKPFDLSDFSGKLTALEIYTQKGNTRQVELLVREIYQDIRMQLLKHEELEERNMTLTRTLQDQQDKLRTIKESMRQAVEYYESSLLTFEKFRKGITSVQMMRSFKELPGVLEGIRELLNVRAVSLVLNEQDYGSFVGREVFTASAEEIRSVCRELFLGKGKETYLGRTTSIDESMGRLGLESRESSIISGSAFVHALHDKYNPREIIGIISLFDSHPKRYTPDKATDFLDHFCDILGCTIVTVRDHEKLDREKVIDPLTRINNREYLKRHAPRILDFAARKGFPVILLFIDLDGFKTVNDNLGHDAGDRILSEVASRLKALVRQYDIVVRMGGDEFVMLLPDITDDDARGIKDRVKSEVGSISVSQCCRKDTDLTISASVGMSTLKKGQTMEELLGAADKAMYEDKKSGQKM